MSLINNMLKDLHNREHTSGYRPAIVLKSAANKYCYSHFKNKPFWTGLFFSCLCVLLFFSFTSHQDGHTLAPAINNHEEMPIDTSRPLNQDNQWLTTTVINGISLQEKDHITEISFMLDHSALYRLVSNDVSNQLTVIFDNAQLQAGALQTQTLHTALRSIQSQTLNGNVIFNLTLTPDASIKYVNLNTDGKYPELVIAIEHNTDNINTSAAPSVDMMKIPAMQTLYLAQYQSALNFAERGDYQSAMQHLTVLLKAQPSYQDARVTLAALLIDQGNASKAEAIINDGLRMNPDFIPLIELKARLLTSQGQIKKALDLLQTESPPINENPEYHAFIAALYQKNDSNLLAIRLYKRLLALNPQNGNWWFGLGLSLEKLGEPSLAYDAYKKAIASGNVNQQSLAYLQNHIQSIQDMTNDNK